MSADIVISAGQQSGHVTFCHASWTELQQLYMRTDAVDIARQARAAATLCAQGFEGLVRDWALERAAQLITQELLQPQSECGVPALWNQIHDGLQSAPLAFNAAGALQQRRRRRRRVWRGFGRIVARALECFRGYYAILEAIDRSIVVSGPPLAADFVRSFRALLLNSAGAVGGGEGGTAGGKADATGVTSSDSVGWTAILVLFFEQLHRVHARRCRNERKAQRLASSSASMRDNDEDMDEEDDEDEDESESESESDTDSESESDGESDDAAATEPATATAVTDPRRSSLPASPTPPPPRTAAYPRWLGLALRELQWGALVDEALEKVVAAAIDKRVQRKCGGYRITGAALGDLEDWLAQELLPWLDSVTCGAGASVHAARLQFALHASFGSLRVKQLFDVVIQCSAGEEDDIDPAGEVGLCLSDLRRAINVAQLHRPLVNALRASLTRRLLIPGVKTGVIIKFYISMIRVLQLLEPSGVLLEAVAEPVKRYLRQRSDTVRVVITGVTDEENHAGLASLLRRGGGQLLDGVIGHGDSDDDDTAVDGGGTAAAAATAGAAAAGWQPDPIEADPAKTAHSRRSTDELSMLVGIYGSQELFVQEYRTILCDQLLKLRDFNTESHYSVIELLKLRFGDDALRKCEIMLQDVDNSRRVLANIRGSQSAGAEAQDLSAIDAKVLSHHFWPPKAHVEKFELHRTMRARLDAFAQRYGVLKNPRRLNWHPALGTVELELHRGGNTYEFEGVSPFAATAIMHFQGDDGGRDAWPLADLARVLGAPEDATRRVMAWWVNRGVVREDRSGGADASKAAGVGGRVYVLCLGESSANDGRDGPDGGAGVPEDDEADEREAEANATAAARDAHFENYIKTMCINLGSLPLKNIHNMMLIFAEGGDHPYEMSELQLREFLAKMVSKDILELANGEYSVKPG